MRRYLLLFTLILICLPSYAQKKHLDFKGIPLDGPYNQFVASLQRLGFKTDKPFPYGPFFSDNPYSECSVLILSTMASHTVYGINVSMRNTKEGDFNDFVELYKKKYGQPRLYYSNGNPYNHELNRSKRAIDSSSLNNINDNDSGSYYAVFNNSYGEITITLNIEVRKTFVKNKLTRTDKNYSLSVAYNDAVNSVLNKNEMKNAQDISNNIKDI